MQLNLSIHSTPCRSVENPPFKRLLNGVNNKLTSVSKNVESIAIEIFSISALAATYFIDLSNKEPKTENCSKTPILLVHGYLHNSSGWLYVKDKLESAGIGPIYAVNLGSPFHSIDDYANIVNKKIEEIARKNPSSKIILVGHSMGGLVSSHCVLRDETLRDNVSKIVTIGSPLGGTKLAKIGIGPCTKEMRINSPFINNLKNKIEQEKDISFLHIGSKTDLIISPTDSAFIQGQNKKIVELDRLGHAGLLFSPRVASEIINFVTDSAS